MGPAGGSVTNAIAVFSDSTGQALESSGARVFSGFLWDAGRDVVAGDTTNDTATMANSGLSISLAAARLYAIRCVLFVSNSTAADGVKVDLGGGTATATYVRAHGLIFDSALRTSSQVSDLTTDILAATVTGDTMVTIEGLINVADAGTLVVQFAMNAATTGTLTLYAGSYLMIQDMGSGGV